jgi:hypothetical protein
VKNKKERIGSLPCTFKDAMTGVLYTILIVCILVAVHYHFGGAKIFDTNITSFFGAILAFSGLMTKQYLFKETIDYLTKWVRLEKLLCDILLQSGSRNRELKVILGDIEKQSRLAKVYSTYIKRELRIIPLVPIILVILYGSALIATASTVFRMICLGLMLFLVTYLAKATISSNNLAIEKPNLEETIAELEDLSRTIEAKHAEHQL